MKLLLPRDTDIILGAGGIGRHHAGNKWFRRQLEPHKINYQQIEGRADKRTFLTSILQEIIASGRCFYKKESPNKYCIVGLEDRFQDGHLILEHKVRNLLSARARAATITTAAIVNGDSSNNSGKCSNNSGKFLYFQTMRWGNKKGHLRFGAPRKEKDKYCDILSEGKDVISQLNMSVDLKYQLYIIRGLHNTPHAVEDEGKRDQCSRILQQQHHATVTEMREHNNGDGVELLEGTAANYTSTSCVLQEVVSMAFPSNCMEDLAEYIYTNGKCNRNRDVGDHSKRFYIGFGQVQRYSETFGGQKMPTFNSNHLQHLPTHLQVSLAKILSFSQTKLHEQFSSRTASGSVNSRSDYVRTKWQLHYNVHKVQVNWDFEFVDISMRSCDGKLLRHCDYKNDWRSNNDGCAVFSYSVHIRGKKYRVVMVMTSRYTVGAPFEKIVTKQCNKKRRYPNRRK